MMEASKISLLAIIGPTAAGKTKVAIEVAKKLKGEIISADSVQVYKYLDIGTAKPTLQERQGIKHYMIDIIDPDKDFTVAHFQKLALHYVKKITDKGKLPIITGGTGLYVKSVIDCYEFTPQGKNIKIREILINQAQCLGTQSLYKQLLKIDPQAAQKIHPNDLRRIVRALEVYYGTGKPISWQVEQTAKKSSPFKLLICGLHMRRDKLYARINKRVDEMINKGLLEEVKSILEQGYNPNLKSLQSLGYRHMISYITGKMEWEEAVETLKRDTRRFAKRQLTWFRKDNRIKWFEIISEEDYNLVVNQICQLVGQYFHR